jgi:ribosomal protein S18 acetylase RimI-like enzyme
MPSDLFVRRITLADLAKVSYLVNNAEYIHRHLDWRGAVDWVGKEPFLGIEYQDRLLAALACPNDGTDIGWFRIFAFLDWNTRQLTTCWEMLLASLLTQIEPGKGYTLAALGLHDWLSNLLKNSGFAHRQDIVVLQWMGEMRAARPLPPEITLRPMLPADIPNVVSVDHHAFHPLWRHSQLELEMALQQASYASVADMNGEIIGYQISTGTPFHAHLARLAVDPGLQRLSIGYTLVWDMLGYFQKRGTSSVSVNSPSDNFSSLALYDRLNFQRTGDEYPVYTLFIP